MFFDDADDARTQVTFGRALRHLLLFQLKLAADALRDFLFSPASVIVFLLDALRRPRLQDSYYVRLMLLGRRTDRLINLFEEHADKGDHTIDEAVETLERMARGGDGPQG